MAMPSRARPEGAGGLDPDPPGVEPSPFRPTRSASRIRRQLSCRCPQLDALCGLHRVGEPVAPGLVVSNGETGVSDSGEIV